uniref:Uncharacterized protein n=1 Tax=uncultured nuHF1 cluster bacterium HF0130_31E21 TaxID=710728 RepID=E0XTN7_9BACT|nr:hypothetical protein [uncultured nuHF1 cluster bacterium HF0130_31E21]
MILPIYRVTLLVLINWGDKLMHPAYTTKDRYLMTVTNFYE